MKIKSILLITIFSFCIKAQIPNGYYNSAQGLSGTNLKIALYNIIKNHTSLAYSALWNAFPKTDVKSNGKVYDIYSYKPTGPQPYEFTFVTNQCGNYNGEGDCFNREHSWPQSWFNSDVVPSSDLFHVYPTDGHVNNVRANYPYGKVGNASTTTQNGSKLGNCVSPGYSQTVFEPIDEFKGDLARTYFYMTTRYYSEDGSWSSSGGTNGATILPWQVNVLVQWHQQDPVSTKEIARNDSIYKLQLNRNPYIDNPQWVIDVFGANAGIEENALQKNFSIYPNPSNEIVSISVQNFSANCKLINCLGEVVYCQNFSNQIKINTKNFSKGIYFIKLDTEKESAIKKLIVN